MTNLTVGTWISSYNQATNSLRNNQQITLIRKNEFGTEEGVTATGEAYLVILDRNDKHFNAGCNNIYAIKILHPLVQPCLDSLTANLELARNKLEFYKTTMWFMTKEQLSEVLGIYRTEFNSSEKLTIEVIIEIEKGKWRYVDEFTCINPGDHSEYHLQSHLIPDFYSQILKQRVKQLEMYLTPAIKPIQGKLKELE